MVLDAPLCSIQGEKWWDRKVFPLYLTQIIELYEMAYIFRKKTRSGTQIDNKWWWIW